MLGEMAQTVTTTGILDWVERMGGWGVVVLVVYWLTTRWEKRMDAQAEKLTSLAEAIHEQTLKYGQLGTHLLNNQNAIKQDIRTYHVAVKTALDTQVRLAQESVALLKQLVTNGKT